MLIPKYITSQTGQQIITVHILPNMSRIKDNLAKQFGHLTKYNVRNIKLGMVTSSRLPFLKKYALNGAIASD